MKRSIALFLVTAMVLTLASSAFADRHQSFTSFDIYYVPTRHDAVQDSNNVVTITQNTDSANWVSVRTYELKTTTTTDVLGNTTKSTETMYSVANQFAQALDKGNTTTGSDVTTDGGLAAAEIAGNNNVAHDALTAGAAPGAVDAVTSTTTGDVAAHYIAFTYSSAATLAADDRFFVIFDNTVNPTLPSGTVGIMYGTLTFSNGAALLAPVLSETGTDTLNGAAGTGTPLEQVFGCGTNSEAFNQVFFSLVFKDAKYAQTWNKVGISVANIPADWRNGDVDRDGVVTLAKNDDKDAYMKVEIRKKDNSSWRLEDAGETLRNEVGGAAAVAPYNALQGLYYFTYTTSAGDTTGVGTTMDVAEFVFDTNFNPNVPEGYFVILKRAFKGNVAPGAGAQAGGYVVDLNEVLSEKDFRFMMATMTFDPEKAGASVPTTVTPVLNATTRTAIIRALRAEDTTLVSADVNFVAAADISDPLTPDERVVSELAADGYTIFEALPAIQVGTTAVGAKGVQAFEVTASAAAQAKKLSDVRLVATRRTGGVGGASYTWVEAAAGEYVEDVDMRDDAGAKLTGDTIPATFFGTVKVDAADKYGIFFAEKTSPTPDTKSQDVTPTPTPTPDSTDQTSDDNDVSGSGGGGCVAGFGSVAGLAALLALALRKRGC